MGINSGEIKPLKVFSMEKIAQNEISFLDLLVAIETSDKRLSLLLAVCDRDDLRDSITERYECELAVENISAYRVTIDHQDPSLYAAINKLIDTEPYLQSVNPAVITVEGIVSLSDFAPEGARSPFDTFLGYLQWTREGMRKFPFPIVIWVSERIHNEISRKAQDFYSWRQGVFFFEVEQEQFIPIDFPQINLTTNDDSDSGLDLPIDELLSYISQREAEGKQDASLATFYTLLAKAYKKDKQIDLAIATWQKTIALQQDLNPSLDLAHSLNELGILYSQQEKYNQAEPLFKQALALGQELLGEHDPDIAFSLNNLAELYRNQRRYEEAEPLFKQALAIRQKLLGDHHSDVPRILNNLAELYRNQRRYEEAEPLFKQALAIRQKLLGDHHSDVPRILNNLAKMYSLQRRYKEVEPLLKQALAVRQKLLGDHHSDVASSLINLAEFYGKQRRYEEAEPLFKQALSIRQKLLGDHHSDVAMSLTNLAILYSSQERYEEAESLHKQALAMKQKLLGDQHPDVANKLFNLADLYHTMERNSESLKLMHRVILIYKQTFGSNHPTTKAAQSWLLTISETNEKGKEKKEKKKKGGFGVPFR
jgi:tetratricopeptide (TPR) repeat protein